MTLRDERRLVAVYDTEDEARNAVRVLERSGVDVAQTRLADDRDHASSIKGEMRSETVHAVAGPGNVGPLTKEMTGGSLLGLMVGGLVGFLLALPVAIVGIGGLSRVVGGAVVAGVGIVVGATAGSLIAGAFAAKRPEEPLAAERGTTLAAERGTTLAAPLSEQAQQVLTTTNPRRIDLVAADGHPVSVVAERDDRTHHVVRDIARHMAAEDRSS
jgi:hypothetical protein